MAGTVFIGDELTGAGFRLAGASVYTPGPEQLEDTVRKLLPRATLLIVTEDVASALPGDWLRQVVTRAHPPLAVVPAALPGRTGPDLEHEVRIGLGMEA